jgi:DNA polymerase III delta subunit
VANYLQYLPKASNPKKITWICGSEKVLVEDLVDRIRKAVGGIVSRHQAGEDPSEIWDDLNQHPMSEQENKLIIVREAQKIQDWQPFLDWAAELRSIPRNYGLFVSDDHDLDTSQPHQAIARDRGSIVRCGAMQHKALTNWLQQTKPMSDDVAGFVIDRTGGSPLLIRDFLAKVSLFTGALSKDVADVLIPASPASEFVNHLVANQKLHALRSLESMGPEHCRAVHSQLDQKLDLLEQLHYQIRQGRTGRDLAIHFGTRAFLIPSLMPHVAQYSPDRTAARRLVLASVNQDRDSMVALVSLW